MGVQGMPNGIERNQQPICQLLDHKAFAELVQVTNKEEFPL